jgi:hypothetical protein
VLFFTTILEYCQEKDRSRLTVVGIACFGKGFEKESLCTSGETDFDPSCRNKTLNLSDIF